MKEDENKTSVAIEDMARVFNRLNISLKKLLELYSGADENIGSLHFDRREIEKYLCKKEIEDYRELSEKCEDKDEFMFVGQIEEYEK